MTEKMFNRSWKKKIIFGWIFCKNEFICNPWSRKCILIYIIYSQHRWVHPHKPEVPKRFQTLQWESKNCFHLLSNALWCLPLTERMIKFYSIILDYKIIFLFTKILSPLFCWWIKDNWIFNFFIIEYAHLILLKCHQYHCVIIIFTTKNICTFLAWF